MKGQTMVEAPHTKSNWYRKNGRIGLYKKLKEAEKEESVARKHHDEILELTKSPDHDPDDVSVLRQLDRASMELEVVRYRVQIIQSDLELESGIQFGSGLHKAPLEYELQDLETQLEKTLSAKQAAEDRLQTLTTARTGSSESEDRRTSRHVSDPVNFTRANTIDTRSHHGGLA